jgi:hypothetical protein
MNGIKVSALFLLLFYASADCVMTRAENEAANVLEKKARLLIGLKNTGWEVEATKLVNRLEREYVPKGYDIQKLNELKYKLNMPIQQPVYEEKKEEITKPEPIVKPVVKRSLPELDKLVSDMLRAPVQERDGEWYGAIGQYIYEISRFDQAKASAYAKKVYGDIGGEIPSVPIEKPVTEPIKPIEKPVEQPVVEPNIDDSEEVIVLSLGKRKQIGANLPAHNSRWTKVIGDHYTTASKADFEYPVVKAMYKNKMNEYKQLMYKNKKEGEELDWRIRGQEYRAGDELQFPEALPESFIKKILIDPQVRLFGTRYGTDFIIKLDENSKKIVAEDGLVVDEPIHVVVTLGKKRIRETKKITDSKRPLINFFGSTIIDEYPGEIMDIKEYPVVKALYKKDGKVYDWRKEGQKPAGADTFPEDLPAEFVEAVADDKPLFSNAKPRFILTLDKDSKEMVENS